MPPFRWAAFRLGFAHPLPRSRAAAGEPAASALTTASPYGFRTGKNGHASRKSRKDIPGGSR